MEVERGAPVRRRERWREKEGGEREGGRGGERSRREEGLSHEGGEDGEEFYKQVCIPLSLDMLTAKGGLSTAATAQVPGLAK